MNPTELYNVSRLIPGQLVLATNPDACQFGENVRIDAFTKLEGEVIIGNGVHIASFSHIGIGGGITYLDDYSSVGSSGKLISGSVQMDGKSMSATAPQWMVYTKRSFVRLMPYATVLTGGIVLPGVTLNEGSVLAAGGVATHDIPAWEVWGGVPARFMFLRRPQNPPEMWMQEIVDYENDR